MIFPIYNASLPLYNACLPFYNACLPLCNASLPSIMHASAHTKVLQEVLRLYPVVSATSRENSTAVMLESMHIPKGFARAILISVIFIYMCV